MGCFEETPIDQRDIAGGKKMLNNLNLCVLAASLRGCETLIKHHASMTHSCLPREDRLASGITDGLVRMSVGVENVEDIIADLEQTFDRLVQILYIKFIYFHFSLFSFIIVSSSFAFHFITVHRVLFGCISPGIASDRLISIPFALPRVPHIAFHHIEIRLSL
jgi:hypothetical protein